MSFQKKTLKVATVILIITLAILGWMLYKNAWKSKFPPHTSQCPDFWYVADDADGAPACESGTANIPSATTSASLCPSDFKIFEPPWTTMKGYTDDCKKYNWSKKCKVKWDGVSNNSSLCNSED